MIIIINNLGIKNSYYQLNMKIELEKKFIVKNNEWKKLVYKNEKYIQGYITDFRNKHKFGVLRIRIHENSALLCIKWQNVIEDNLKRIEFEYKIPIKDAKIILENMCIKPILYKTRYFVKYDNDSVWEIDVFEEENAGLIIAEIELKDRNKRIIKPKWIGKEVTNNNKYLNYNLVKKPFSKWNKICQCSSIGRAVHS